MKLLNIDDILHMLSFIFTTILIIIFIIKGLKETDLILNIMYFVVLNITFLRYLFRDRGE